MGQYDEPEAELIGINYILSEILVVLKRIDGHLEVQDRHLRDLDEQVSTLEAERTTDKRLPQTTEPPAQNFSQSGQPRRGSSRPVSPSTRRQDLGPLSTSRSSHSSTSNVLESPTATIFERGTFPKSSSWKTESKSPTARYSSISKIGHISRSGTWDSLLPPATAHVVYGGHDDDLEFYSQFPPPESWIVTRTQGRVLGVKYASVEAQRLWESYVGDSWTIPPDGRIEMTFQRHLLERLNEAQAVSLLATLQEVSSKLEYQNASDVNKRGSFKVTDYEFDPDFEESVAEYRADIPIGKFRKYPVKRLRMHKILRQILLPGNESFRGLSKKLIDEHETWTSNFRDPWNEALPIVNPICPFLTNRVDDSSQNIFHGMRAISDAVLQHQQCWRRPPPNDDELCFHITFYELIDLTHENELEGEIWQSGKLHSDAEKDIHSPPKAKCRRIRESACTAIMTQGPLHAHYWTLLILIPNTFILYDPTHNYEQYDTITQAIRGADAFSALQTMISSTIRIVISRWEKIADYFAQGHRDTLRDPDVHDRLLFDDDSFSRSRRYFWAFNYLAELEVSISANITQVERFVKEDKALAQQLNQLQYLRERLRGQRAEAIALRDGLFSASGVMESRASTRLGENIELLTFVSIFFLPLSFCMSVWSINTSVFSLRALIITVLLAGLGTYFMVFNLNSMVAFCGRWYSLTKARVVDGMKADIDDKWAEIGRRFVASSPDTEEERKVPSEWRLVLFLFYRMARKMGLGRKVSKEEPTAVERKSSAVMGVIDWGHLPVLGQEDSDAKSVGESRTEEDGEGKELKEGLESDFWGREVAWEWVVSIGGCHRCIVGVMDLFVAMLKESQHAKTFVIGAEVKRQIQNRQ